jgi:DDE superfamily endonuclease
MINAVVTTNPRRMFTVTGVLADAEFGDNRLFRAMLHRLRLPYAVGISSSHTVFLGTPALRSSRPSPRGGRPRTYPKLAAGVHARPLGEAIRASPPGVAGAAVGSEPTPCTARSNLDFALRSAPTR